MQIRVRVRVGFRVRVRVRVRGVKLVSAHYTFVMLTHPWVQMPITQDHDAG